MLRSRLRAHPALHLTDPPRSPSGLAEGESFLFMRRVGVAMFLLGAGTLLATLALPDPDASDHTAIRVIAVLLGLGAVAVWSNRVYRPWLVRASVVYGILLVSALMAVTRPIEATPFFYLWPVLFSAYFFSRRDVVIDLAILWVTMGLALFIWSKDPMKQVMFMGVGVSVTLAGIVVMALREHLSSLIAQLEEASATDYLTGLLNRRAFDGELERQIERARRSGLPLAITLFDLDHFKQVNDRLGHAAGDRALCSFAALLGHRQRSGDTLARIGGEEFAVVLFGADLDAARGFAERIAREARELRSGGIPLSTSAGVAALSETEASPRALLVAADRALYGAKTGGRRRVAVWDGGTILVGERIEEPGRLALGAA